MHIKKGDNVIILSGDDKGKTGKVVKAFPAKNQIVVEGINVINKHERARKQGQKGQVVQIAMPFDASKVKNADDTKGTKVVKAKKVESKK
jgi:large subunit ribosomal protein L24